MGSLATIAAGDLGTLERDLGTVCEIRDAAFQTEVMGAGISSFLCLPHLAMGGISTAVRPNPQIIAPRVGQPPREG